MIYTALVYVSSLLLLVIINEGLVELVSKSVFFSFLRDFLTQSTSKVLKFFGEAISCPYCCSVWTAGFLVSVVFLFGPQIKVFNVVIDFLFLTILIHRLSNYLHDVADKFFNESYSIKKE